MTSSFPIGSAPSTRAAARSPTSDASDVTSDARWSYQLVVCSSDEMLCVSVVLGLPPLSVRRPCGRVTVRLNEISIAGSRQLPLVRSGGWVRIARVDRLGTRSIRRDGCRGGLSARPRRLRWLAIHRVRVVRLGGSVSRQVARGTRARTARDRPARLIYIPFCLSHRKREASCAQPKILGGPFSRGGDHFSEKHASSAGRNTSTSCFAIGFFQIVSIMSAWPVANLRFAT